MKVTVTGLAPEVTPRATSLQLTVRLVDQSRPDATCDEEHPLSGCVTVDWSDSEARPNVPPGGVFDNSLVIDLESGLQTFYLSESGSLADQPDAFAPG